MISQTPKTCSLKYVDANINARLERLSWGATVACFLFGLTVSIGWACDIDWLKNPMLKQVPVAPTTAGAFLLLSTGLLIYKRRSNDPLFLRAAAVTVMIMSVTILHAYADPTADFEKSLLGSHLGALQHSSPGRMAPNTALGLIFASISAFLLCIRNIPPHRYFYNQLFACLAAFTGYFTIIGYMLGFHFMIGLGRYTSMALPTGLALNALAMAILFHCPRLGITAPLVSKGISGTMARRLMVGAIALPVLVGIIRVYGQKAGLWDWDFGACFFVVSMTVVSLWLVVVTSRSIQQVDEEREKLWDQRDNIIAVLVHDLKNPLIGADKIYKMLLEGQFEQLTDPQSSIVKTLQTSNEELLDKIKNLLELYRLDKNKCTLSICRSDIITAVHSAIAKHRDLAAAQNKTIVQTHIAPSIFCHADIAALEHVFSNLIQNAIKFSPEGAEILIRTEILGNLVLVKVIDTGRGISPADQEHLFRPFYQGATGKEAATGTGLGLYLCHQIVEAHGGHINCLSEVGKGATFVVSLPIKPHQPTQDDADAESQPANEIKPC